MILSFFSFITKHPTPNNHSDSVLLPARLVDSQPLPSPPHQPLQRARFLSALAPHVLADSIRPRSVLIFPISSSRPSSPDLIFSSSYARLKVFFPPTSRPSLCSRITAISRLPSIRLPFFISIPWFQPTFTVSFFFSSPGPTPPPLRHLQMNLYCLSFFVNCLSAREASAVRLRAIVDVVPFSFGSHKKQSPSSLCIA